MKMKKRLLRLLSTALLAGFLFAQTAILAAPLVRLQTVKNTTTAAQTTMKLNVSFYDEVEKINRVVKTSISYPVSTTWDVDFFACLKEKGLIKNYVYRANFLSSVTFNDNTTLSTGTDSAGRLTGWTYYLNDRFLNVPFSQAKVKNDDIIEWRYVASGTTSSESHTSTVSSDIPVHGSNIISDPSEPVSDLSSLDSEESNILSSENSVLSDTSSTTTEPSTMPSDTSSKAMSAASRAESKIVVQNPNRYEWTPQLSDALDNACAYLQRNEEGSFYLVALGAAGKSVEAKIVQQHTQSIVNNTSGYTRPTDLERDILGVTFSGLNPTNIQGKNLIAELEKYEDIGKQGLVGVAYGLIALDSNDYVVSDTAVNTRQALIDTLCAAQKEDGGFGLSEKVDSDVDVTSIVLTALSSYRTQAKVQTALSKGIDYLSKQQLANGHFASLGVPSSESVSQVIVLLNSLQLSMDDQRFIKGGKSVVDVLMEYRSTDGGFSHDKNGASDVMSTEQAVLAMVALKNGTNPFKINYTADNTSSSHSGLSDSAHKTTLLIVMIVTAAVLLLAAAGLVFFLRYRKLHRERQDRTPSEQDVNQIAADSNQQSSPLTDSTEPTAGESDTMTQDSDPGETQSPS